jgi:hypothetical protein
MISFVNGTAASAAATGLLSNEFVAIAVTQGNLLLVVASFNGTSSSVSSVSDTIGTPFSLIGALDNGTLERVEVWGGFAPSTNGSDRVKITVSPATSAGAAFALVQYSSVAALGKTSTNTGTGTIASVSLVIDDANDFVAGAFVGDNTGTFSANVGNLRETATETNLKPASLNAGAAEADNTSASAGSTVDVAVSISKSEDWAGIAVELRSVIPPPVIVGLDLRGFGLFTPSSPHEFGPETFGLIPG